MKKYIYILALLFSGIISAQTITVNGDPYGGGGGSGTDDQTITDFSLSGDDLSITIEGGNTVEVDISSINTDAQTVTDLSITSNILSITLSGGNTATVDLSPYLDNTDNQTIDVLSLNSGILSVSLSGDGEANQTVDLSSLGGGETNPNTFVPSSLDDIENASNAGKVALVRTTLTLTEDITPALGVILKDEGGLIVWDGFDIIGNDTQVIFLGDKQFFDIGDKTDAFQGTWIAPEVVSFKNFGAIADFKEFHDGAITASGTTFTSSTASFTSSDVGKNIQIQGAGTAPSGGDLGTPTLLTTIASFTNSTTVELTDSAISTVSGASFKFGTDNYEEGLAAINLRNFNSGTLRIPYDNNFTKGGRYGTRIVDEEPLLANRPIGWVIGDGVDYIKVNGGGAIETIAHNEYVSRFIYIYKTNFTGIEDLRIYGDKEYHVNSGEGVGTDEFNFGIAWSSGSNWTYGINLMITDFHGDAMIGYGNRQQTGYIKGDNISPTGIESDLTIGNIDDAGTIDTGETDYIYATDIISIDKTEFDTNIENDPLGRGWFTLSEIAVSGWGGLTYPYYDIAFYDESDTFIEKVSNLRIYDRIPLLNKNWKGVRPIFYRVKDKEDINLQVNPTIYPQGLYLENVHLDNCTRQGFSNPPSNMYWNGGRITNIGEALPSYGIDIEDVRWETKGIVIQNVEFENCFGGGIKLVGTEDVKIINCTFKKTNALWEGSQTYYALSVDYGRDVVMNGNIIYDGNVQLGRYNHFTNNQCYAGVLSYSAEGVIVENNLFHNYKRQSLETSGKDFEKGIMRNNTWTYDLPWSGNLFRDHTNKMDIIGDKFLFNRLSRITSSNDSSDQFLELNSTTGTVWQTATNDVDYGGIVKDVEFSGIKVELTNRDVNDGGMTPRLQDHEDVFYGTSVRWQYGIPRDYYFKDVDYDGWVEFDLNQFEDTIISETPTIYMIGGSITISEGNWNWTNTGSQLLDTPVKNVNFYIENVVFDLQVTSSQVGSSNRYMDLNHLGTTVFKNCTFKSASAKTIDFSNTNIFPAGLGAVTIIDPITENVTFTARSGDKIIYNNIGEDGAISRFETKASPTSSDWVLIEDDDDGEIKKASFPTGGGGGASELSDLTDVGTTTPTDRNVLVADGDSWESRALVEADISDLSYTSDSDIETAYNNQVSQVSGGEITAGTETAIRRFSPDDIEAMIATHGTGVNTTSSLFFDNGTGASPSLGVSNTFSATDYNMFMNLTNSNGYLNFQQVGGSTVSLLMNLTSFRPSASGTIDLGLTGARWDQGWFNGNVFSSAFVTSGGTSGQFVKGDGSLDSNTYLSAPTVNQFTVNRTAQIGEANGTVNFSSGGALTYTVPVNTTTSFPLGTKILISNEGATSVTLTEDSGVTFIVGTAVLSAGDAAYLIHVTLNEWLIINF